jgi:DNA (cytosine-5)-methyltransferase 1
MALDDVCLDLETAGYQVQPFVFPACGVGAWHRRERVFIIAADAEQQRRHDRRDVATGGDDHRNGRIAEAGRDGDERRLFADVGAACADVPDAERGRCEQRDEDERTISEPHAHGHDWLGWDGRQPLDTIWEREPVGSVGVMADGISPRLVGRLATGEKNRVNKLRALGNAVVPQQAYMVLAAIYEALHE